MNRRVWTTSTLEALLAWLNSTLTGSPSERDACVPGMTQSATPFIGTEALAAGAFTKRTLHSRNQLIHRNVYLSAGQQLTPVTRAIAAWLWSGRNATVAGMSAAALHGTDWIDADLPAELCRVEGATNGIVVHRNVLCNDEICLIDGMSVTTPARTAFDIGRRGTETTAVIRLDALANATGLSADAVLGVAEHHRRARGIVQLRKAVDLMDGGAESPQETRTRLLLVRSGLRRPQTQIVVDPWRIDMGWEEFLVGVEYDGPQHWTDPSRRNRDIEKYAQLAERGWIIIRVNSELLRNRPHVVVQRVCAALRAHGCSWLDECGVDPRFLLRTVA
jgi:very-short-patch-repair endonuclease